VSTDTSPHSFARKKTSAAANAAPGKDGLVHDAIHEHARNVAGELVAESPVLAKLVGEGRVKIAVAVYDLESGTVDWD